LKLAKDRPVRKTGQNIFVAMTKQPVPTVKTLAEGLIKERITARDDHRQHHPIN
jgi:hypothetical protein